MNIARPPNGFRLVEADRVHTTLSLMRDSCPWLDQAYADAVARLKMSGHREGRLSQSIPGLRSVVEIDPLSETKRLGISYQAIGDTLIVFNIRVLAVDIGQISN